MEELLDSREKFDGDVGYGDFNLLAEMSSLTAG